MKKNDEILLEITGMTAEGNGVGRYNGMAVFVPETVVGECVKAHVIKVSKNYAVAKLVSIENKSENRIESDCTVSSSCGGCSYRHITYKEECNIKYNKVYDAFKRIAGLNVSLDSIISAVSENRYRNKAQYPISKNSKGETVIGFYAGRTHRVIDNAGCLLQPIIFDEISNTVKSWIDENGISVYDEMTHTGLMRHLYIRYAEVSGEIMVCLVVNGNDIPNKDDLVSKLLSTNKNIVSIQFNINKEKTNIILGAKTNLLHGKKYITDTICGVNVRISAHSFYQVNRNMAEILYQKAAEFAEPQDKNIIDLYCGVGTIGLSMAKYAKNLIGVEIVPEAIEDAKFNAKANSFDNAEFIVGDAALAAKELANRNIKADVVILDPPRKGCDADLIKTVANDFAPERVVYVSCDPATLARDCKIFDELGYKVVKAVPVDLFPRTVHVESVALLSRQIDVQKMRLNSAPFEMIKCGEKTIELRLFDEKRQQLKAGDKIVFTNTTTGETLNTTVVKLHRFNTFNELYKSLPLLQCGYTSENIDKATPSDMEQYYSVEEQRKYGVVGIEICRPKEITDESIVCLVTN